MTFVIAAFYKFVRLPDVADTREPLLSCCRQQGLKGTILLAEEGINGTIAGPRHGIDAVLAFLKAEPRLASLEHKESCIPKIPFNRMKVRLKQEIISLGVPNVDPSEQVGTYVKPGDWNALISDPGVVVVDTRNDYEVSVGTFRGAHNPQTVSFREFPAYVRHHLDPRQHRKIAMFCTGGIRCEKASSYLLQQGFEAVYHLKGGILKYLEEIPAEESLWQGECFVFDDRIAVIHGLGQGSYEICHGCGNPVSPLEQTSPQYRTGISCPRCFESLTAEKQARLEERKRQLELDRKRQQPCPVGSYSLREAQDYPSRLA